MNKLKVSEELLKRGITLDKDGNVKRFNPNYFPKLIKINFPIIYAKDKTYYVYEGGVYEMQDDGKLLRDLRDVFQAPKFGVWTPSIERDYMIGMERELYYDGELNLNKNLINLVNNMFDTESFTLLTHNPKYYSTIRIPIEFKVDAECPRWKEFLRQVFDGDEERIKVAQEWAGYILTAATSAQKARRR
ncbi:hypothetical protein [Clostridium estertheticum]|uniref:hypothetical protein n=1 Tax=Clostridium estertheticum TaxID=238834 RepID=UPI001CF3C1DE|nr:hypothetical protein [Clostridium estertheticum]MCB2354722.1 hypothetical protein [Clostridium estertheticum]WAG40964.1 hypothetical protein LL065_22420 [Clostridium estertheticum]